MLGLSAAAVGQTQGATLTAGTGLKERGGALRNSPRAQPQAAVASDISQKKAQSTKARKGSSPLQKKSGKFKPEKSPKKVNLAQTG